MYKTRQARLSSVPLRDTGRAEPRAAYLECGGGGRWGRWGHLECVRETCPLPYLYPRCLEQRRTHTHLLTGLEDSEKPRQHRGLADKVSGLGSWSSWSEQPGRTPKAGTRLGNTATQAASLPISDFNSARVLISAAASPPAASTYDSVSRSLRRSCCVSCHL